MVGNASYSSSLLDLSSMSHTSWLMDSACCNHMTPHSSSFSELQPAPHPLNIRTANGSTMSGHNIETCYQRNKSVVSISAAIVANTESVQPMAPVFAQSHSSGSTFTISRDDLINIIANVICMVGNASYSLLSQLYLVCLLSLGLWILLVAIT